ncbi:MAG: alpha/beta hydrolase [Halioglobus sp.]
MVKPYSQIHRAPQPDTPASDAFTIHRAEVEPGLQLAFIREGIGGYPLLLLHGYPESKRIWWRNIRPLVEAGFEVIVPDLRGYGDSDLSAKDEYDLVFYARDCHTLVNKVLGHSSCGVIAGDVGGSVSCDLANRFEGFVDKLIFFNSSAPMVIDQAEWYAERGLSLDQLGEHPTGEYRIRQGRDWRELLEELDTPVRCQRYVRDFYEHRMLASPYSFNEDDFSFMTEPFADAERLAASWAPYQLAYDRPMPEMPLVLQTVDVPTMVLYGPDDTVVTEDFTKRCEIAFPNRVGPLVVPDAGHFLQWERADILNDLAKLFFADCKKTN